MKQNSLFIDNTECSENLLSENQLSCSSSSSSSDVYKLSVVAIVTQQMSPSQAHAAHDVSDDNLVTVLGKGSSFGVSSFIIIIIITLDYTVKPTIINSYSLRGRSETGSHFIFIFSLA